MTDGQRPAVIWGVIFSTMIATGCSGEDFDAGPTSASDPEGAMDETPEGNSGGTTSFPSGGAESSGGSTAATGGGASNTGGTGGTGGSDGTGGAMTGVASCRGAGAVFAELTDPTCSDGNYCEVLPDLEFDIGPVVQTYKSTNGETRLNAALELFDAAWPFGSEILRHDLDCAREYIFDDEWSWTNQLGLAIHECGHFWDGWDHYYIASGQTLNQPAQDYFERWEISQDAYYDTIPDAAANDLYFEPGAVTSDQGIQTMYDEWTQYNNSVTLTYLLYSEHESDFDMELALNFAWAAPRYFLWAKDNHPDDFAHMMASEDVREATLVLWGQTLLYYDAMVQHLGWVPSQNEERYLDAMRVPALVEMLNEVRVAHGCDGI